MSCSPVNTHEYMDIHLIKLLLCGQEWGQWHESNVYPLLTSIIYFMYMGWIPSGYPYGNIKLISIISNMYIFVKQICVMRNSKSNSDYLKYSNFLKDMRVHSVQIP